MDALRSGHIFFPELDNFSKALAIEFPWPGKGFQGWSIGTASCRAPGHWHKSEGVQMAGSPLQANTLPDREACWSLLERVAASSQMKRAARLQELLFFIGKRSLREGSETVHEQQIGVEVFRRPKGYDTSADNIVRTNVSDLRKRIESYFESEGAGETLILEIPRGSYVPVFRNRISEPKTADAPIPFQVPAAAVPATKSAEILPAATRSRWAAPARAAVALLIAALAVGCFYFSTQYRDLYRSLYAWQYEPSVSAFWTNFLNGSSDTDVVLADASFGLLQDLNKRSFPFDDYLDRSYINKLQGQHPDQEMQAVLSRIVRWNMGSQDEFKLAQRILALDPLGKRIRLYNARDYMPDLTNRDNVILIGGRISNPWDELFEGRMNFTVRFDSDGSIEVVNRTPAAGERSTYSQANSVQYCVIAYLPNPGHNGNVLMIEGTGAEATEAAGNFLLSEDQLYGFRKALRVDNFPYFEVLLKVSSVQGTPLTATIEAYRAYPR
jgi:hypothetical protein